MFIVPRFVQKKYSLMRFSAYLGIAVLINLSINFILQNFILGTGELKFYDCMERQAYSLQLSMVYIAVAIGIKIFKINLTNSEQISVLEQAKISSELDFLKTQINPHFLFNVLNTIYIQTRIEPKKSSEMILILSDLLRYQLYECSQDKVLLKSEVDNIRNYVNLQQMRIAKIDIKFEQKGTFKGLMIYPFMFMPFLENAFKHGVSSKGVDNFIHIFVEIVEKNVIFVVKNSKIDTSESALIRKGGIGLKNIEKRLKLLYKNNYELKIEDREKYYYVELKIILKL
jgi:LytS/YehU family sensor histidine kinase